MAGLRLLSGPSELQGVRAVCFALAPGIRGTQLLPDSVIQQVSIGGRAEMWCIDRIGPDWSTIMQGSAPAYYAGGDPIQAKALLLDAATLLTASLLCPLLKQLVPSSDKSEQIQAIRDLDWDNLQQEYRRQAQIALALLQPLIARQSVIGPGQAIMLAAGAPVPVGS